MPDEITNPLYLGIDVGTASARAGIFDQSGRMLGSTGHAIQIMRPQAEFVEQSSEDIWQACCSAVRDVLPQAGAQPAQVRGLWEGTNRQWPFMAANLGVRQQTIMAHYMSNHITVAYGDIFAEMIALSRALGFKVRILRGKRNV